MVGVRPEDVEVGLGPAPSNAAAGTIYVLEPMGAEVFVTVELRGGRVTARAPASFSARSGEPAWVKPNAERLHRFDASENRVG